MINNDYKRIANILRDEDHVVYDIYRDFHKIKQEIEAKYPKANFMDGQCMLFHLELARRFPDAKCMFSVDHVVTEIDGSVWDYSGLLWNSPEYEVALYERYLQQTEEFLENEY